MHKISLILPMYNEEELIQRTLEKVIAYFEFMNYDFEILVIDDKSKDNSVSIVKNFNHPRLKLFCKLKNEGKGSAIKEGVKHSTKEYIGFMDADLPYSLEDTSDMINQLKNYDLVIGSRSVEGSTVGAHPLWYRRLLSKGFEIIRYLLINLRIKDTQSGIKFFKKEVAKDIFNRQEINGFGFDTEILYIAKKKNYSIKEVPVHLLKEHSFKKSKLKPIRDSIKMFYDLILIKTNDLRGKYK